MHREHRAAVRSESSSSWLPWRTTGHRQRPPGEPRDTGRDEVRDGGSSGGTWGHCPVLLSHPVGSQPPPREPWGDGDSGTGLELALQPPSMGPRPHPASLATGTLPAWATLCAEPPATP